MLIIRRSARECKRIFGPRSAFYAPADPWSEASSKGRTLVGFNAVRSQTAMALVREGIVMITLTVQDA